jgi:hypothetical protein
MTCRVAVRPLVGAALFACSAAGCGSGGPPARQDVIQAAPGELHGASTRTLFHEFRETVRTRGVEGAKQELPNVLENFATYEHKDVGSHLKTYKQISEKLTSLESALAGTPTKDEVVKAVDEIWTLVDSLPGKAPAKAAP